MIINVTEFNGVASISIEPENEAEKYQLQGIVAELEKANADWGSWDDMEGRNGIAINGKLRI